MKYLKCVKPTSTLTKNKVYLCDLRFDVKDHQRSVDELEESNTIILKNDKGRTIKCNPDRFIEIRPACIVCNKESVMSFHVKNKPDIHACSEHIQRIRDFYYLAMMYNTLDRL